MIGAIRHAIVNLANLNGRDARQTFWFWMLTVFILRYAASMVISLPMTTRIMNMTLQGVRQGDPEGMRKMQQAMFEAMAADMPRMVWYGVAIGVISMLLVAASLVRRLHDSNLSGWLVLVPGALYAAALAQAPQQIAKATEMLKGMKAGTPPDMAGMMQAQTGLAVLAWVAIGLIIWIGVRPSDEGPNRYGDAPVAF